MHFFRIQDDTKFLSEIILIFFLQTICIWRLSGQWEQICNQGKKMGYCFFLNLKIAFWFMFTQYNAHYNRFKD